MKNEKELQSFTSYCQQHPDQRFWQALRNWAEVDYVLIANDNPAFGAGETIQWKDARDTFYIDLSRAERIREEQNVTDK